LKTSKLSTDSKTRGKNNQNKQTKISIRRSPELDLTVSTRS